MKLAKCLLVALALWMPAAAFAAAAASARVEQNAPCEETPTSEESSDSSEENQFFLPSSAVPFTRSAMHTIEFASHEPLDGHIVELLIPPPNRSVSR